MPFPMMIGCFESRFGLVENIHRVILSWLCLGCATALLKDQPSADSSCVLWKLLVNFPMFFTEENLLFGWTLSLNHKALIGLAALAALGTVLVVPIIFYLMKMLQSTDILAMQYFFLFTIFAKNVDNFNVIFEKLAAVHPSSHCLLQ